MPTYSLVLRENIGRKLTIQEMDGNFLYLDNKQSGGSVSINPNEIAFGTGAEKMVISIA